MGRRGEKKEQERQFSLGSERGNRLSKKNNCSKNVKKILLQKQLSKNRYFARQNQHCKKKGMGEYLRVCKTLFILAFFVKNLQILMGISTP